MTDNVQINETIAPTTLEHPEGGLAGPKSLLAQLEAGRQAHANEIIRTEVLPVFRQQLAAWFEDNLTKLIQFEAIEVTLIVPAKTTHALGEYGRVYLISWLSTKGWHSHNHGVADGALRLWVKQFSKPTKVHQRDLLDDLERRSPLR